mmetsp:Transcript_1413/g.3900  ORF Transcript_1413/g.3900 Transcript_1413/m.3900 type:complete len:298 (+) Transcript_1413:562-1455(+)
MGGIRLVVSRFTRVRTGETPVWSHCGRVWSVGPTVAPRNWRPSHNFDGNNFGTSHYKIRPWIIMDTKYFEPSGIQMTNRYQNKNKTKIHHFLFPAIEPTSRHSVEISVRQRIAVFNLYPLQPLDGLRQSHVLFVRKFFLKSNGPPSGTAGLRDSIVGTGRVPSEPDERGSPVRNSGDEIFNVGRHRTVINIRCSWDSSIRGDTFCLNWAGGNKRDRSYCRRAQGEEIPPTHISVTAVTETPGKYQSRRKLRQDKEEEEKSNQESAQRPRRSIRCHFPSMPSKQRYECTMVDKYSFGS